MQVMVPEALEQEVTDTLGRERYTRRGEGQQGWRNGYEPGRIRSAEGEVQVQVPQVRGLGAPYQSRLMDFLRGNSDVLEHLVVQMYARGLSTRDVEEALRDPLSGEVLLSRSAVSELTDSLWGAGSDRGGQGNLAAQPAPALPGPQAAQHPGQGARQRPRRSPSCPARPLRCPHPPGG